MDEKRDQPAVVPIGEEQYQLHIMLCVPSEQLGVNLAEALNLVFKQMNLTGIVSLVWVQTMTMKQDGSGGN